MARDGLFFQSAGRLNAARVPAGGLVLQGVWAALLVLPRTYAGGQYGNLYNDLLDYIISAALLFYVLTIAAVYRLRVSRPEAERPYRAFGYPVVPALYIVGRDNPCRRAGGVSADDDLAGNGHRLAGIAGVLSLERTMRSVLHFSRAIKPACSK